MSGILRALQHVHGKRIIFRDLKPENVLIGEDGEAKLADFGLASAMSEDESQLMTSMAGTPCYIAPEVLARKGYSETADVYSFGVTMAVTMLGDRICRCADIGGRTVMVPNNMIQEMPDKLELLPVPPRAVI